MITSSFMRLSEFAAMAHYYQFLRGRYPLVPAGKVHDFLKGDDGQMSFEQYLCRHEWAVDEESDRTYCVNGCGLDGDA